VVDFYVSVIAQRNSNGDARRRCHCFNSFFYTKLLSSGDYNYEDVRRWMKKAWLRRWTTSVSASVANIDAHGKQRARAHIHTHTQTQIHTVTHLQTRT
jgi:hypothetical protein